MNKDTAKRYKTYIVKNKTLFITLALILLILLTALCTSIELLGSNPSKVNIKIDKSDSTLIGLNSEAKTGKIKGGKTAFFSFSSTQYRQLVDYYNNKTTTALVVTIAVPYIKKENFEAINNAPLPFYYGFLYEKDFNKDGSYSANIGAVIKDGALEAKSNLGKVLVVTDLRCFMKVKSNKSMSIKERIQDKGEWNTFKISFALEKGLTATLIPKGFFIYTGFDIKVLNAAVENAVLGYDYTDDVKFYGMPSNGGVFALEENFDFTGGSLIYKTSNTVDGIMPKIEISYKCNARGEDKTSLDITKYFTKEANNAINFGKFYLNIGGVLYSIYKMAGDNDLTLQAGMLRLPFSRYEIVREKEKIKEDDFRITRLIMKENEDKTLEKIEGFPLFPLPTDSGVIVNSKMNNWRTLDYELYNWDRFNNILIFDTRNYKTQQDFFRRLAFYAEKKGYKGSILTDAQLGSMHGYNAHDYSAKSIASFFTLQEKLGIKINEKEKILKEIALKNKIIISNGGEAGYKEGEGAVISISQESQTWLRSSLFSHEAWHGLYFTDNDFRKFTTYAYSTIDKKAQDFIIGFWDSQETLGYDTSDLILVQNEFMAYIMQQPLGNVGQYFTHLASRGSVMRAIPALCDYVKATRASSFTSIATAFNLYVYDRWGLGCGRVGMIY